MNDQIHPEIFKSSKDFPVRVIEKLWSHPSDFHSAMRRISASGKTATPQRAAGVLLPLIFRNPSPPEESQGGQFFFQLIKRSSYVPQPGDLSCPGGMIHPVIDRLLRPLLLHGPFPIIRGIVRELALRQGSASLKLTTLFLANALRESWEEIRLSPHLVHFLGPLPTYTLAFFRRTIFPLVGFVYRPVSLQPNREVEKIVEIPLTSFYRKELFGCYILSRPDPSEPGTLQSVQHPCLIHRDRDGTEEILWGATFYILVQFLKIVMNFGLPEWKEGRTIQRTLPPDYQTGRIPS